jgi:glycerol-3-phosphate acyltransferase PlsX
MDYAEYCGAPLLGVNGICIKAHGRSNALAIKNAVRVATQAVQNDVVGTIARGLAESAESPQPAAPAETP